MKRFAILLLCAAALLAGCKPAAKDPFPEVEGKNYSSVDTDDAGMNQAIAEAKKTSGQFLEALRRPQPSYRDFAVKKPYPVQGDKDAEHMWITDLREIGDHLEGTIANDAIHTKAVTLGQQVELKIDEISDWQYVDGNKLVGGYTTRYFYQRLGPQEKKEMLEAAGFVID